MKGLHVTADAAGTAAVPDVAGVTVRTAGVLVALAGADSGYGWAATTPVAVEVAGHDPDGGPRVMDLPPTAWTKRSGTIRALATLLALLTTTPPKGDEAMGPHRPDQPDLANPAVEAIDARLRADRDGAAVADGLVAASRPQAAVGDLVQVGDQGVITLHEVILGAGWGSGSGTGADGSTGGGGGGGGFARSRAVAVVTIGPDGVDVKPVFDRTAVLMAAVGAALALGRAVFRRR